MGGVEVSVAYYNTTHLKGIPLKEREGKALTQKDVILDIFRKHRHEEYTPFEILAMWPGRKPPITSIRRAITQLTEDGKLEKTDIMRSGEYGEPNHTWRLKLQNIKGQLKLTLS